MPKFRFQGPYSLRFRSFMTMNRIAIATYMRHAIGRRMAADWDANLEIGIRFWRHQFTVAMAQSDMARGRLIYDSLQTLTDDHYDVDVAEIAEAKGTWYRPKARYGDSVVLHFHGGGYSFHGGISRRFAAMLAHRLQTPVFAPDYRLTPEHPHPAQAEDALQAWHYVMTETTADKLVITGDSAGGHMALMLLQSLKLQDQPQPALCIGLCPWTDIGDRGASLKSNDAYDLVQGWMAIKFGEWLDPLHSFGREALSPCFHDFAGLAPIYLQAGGREVLRDMIIDFADIQTIKGATIALDVWPDMPHEFHAYDRLKGSSVEALDKLTKAVQTRRLPS